jgi:mRNA interferase MazF
MSYFAGDVLLVPVAFTGGSGHKRRPVMVVYDSGDADLLIAPVTSHAARSPRDVPVVDWRQAGLRLPSVIRLEKLATVDKTNVIKRMGRLGQDDWERPGQS